MSNPTTEQTSAQRRHAEREAWLATRKPVVIVDVDIPFSRAVTILLTFGLAAVPAGILLAVVWLALWAMLGGFIMACFAALGGG